MVISYDDDDEGHESGDDKVAEFFHFTDHILGYFTKHPQNISTDVSAISMTFATLDDDDGDHYEKL